MMAMSSLWQSSLNSEHEAQIRYMAVDDKFKRQGIGSEIVTELENYALSKQAKTMTLNAREKAISFYLSWGTVRGMPVSI